VLIRRLAILFYVYLLRKLFYSSIVYILSRTQPSLFLVCSIANAKVANIEPVSLCCSWMDAMIDSFDI
jgi:hypothetical protein